MKYEIYHGATWGGELTTLAAEILKRREEFFAIYATSNCCISRVSGGAQYVTDEVTRKDLGMWNMKIIGHTNKENHLVLLPQAIKGEEQKALVAAWHTRRT